MSDAWEETEEAAIWAAIDTAEQAGSLTASTSNWLGVKEHLEQFPQPSTTPTTPVVFGMLSTESVDEPAAVFAKTTEPPRLKALLIDIYRQADAAKGHFNKACEELRAAFRAASPASVAFLPNLSTTEYHGVEDAYIVERWRMPYWGGAV